jgi:hypothetical protein
MIDFIDCNEYYKLWLILYHVDVANNLEEAQIAIDNCRKHRANCIKCQEITKKLIEEGNSCLQKWS